MHLNQIETKPVVWIIDWEQWPRANLRALLLDRGFDAIGFRELEEAEKAAALRTVLEFSPEGAELIPRVTGSQGEVASR